MVTAFDTLASHTWGEWKSFLVDLAKAHREYKRKKKISVNQQRTRWARTDIEVARQAAEAKAAEEERIRVQQEQQRLAKARKLSVLMERLSILFRLWQEANHREEKAALKRLVKEVWLEVKELDPG